MNYLIQAHGIEHSGDEERELRSARLAGLVNLVVISRNDEASSIQYTAEGYEHTPAYWQTRLADFNASVDWIEVLR